MLRILHLEDDLVDVEVAADSLREEGFAVESQRVASMASLEEQLRHGNYDLILSDFSIPGVNALSALRLAQQLRPELPFIFFSGTIGEEVAIESLKKGATDYVFKQRIARLVPAVRRALEEAKERRLRKASQEALRRAHAELEKTVAERTARLNETLEDLEHFSYTITHDMRAPLRAMKGFAQILAEEASSHLNATEKEYIRRIINASERMDALIADALDYNKLVRQEFVRTEVDVEGLLREMVEGYPEFRAEGVHITMVPPLRPVLANRAGLTQCFSNLLTNAIKFRKPGQDAHVSIRSEEREGSVRLWFEDKGLGIAPEQQKQLFQMFKKLHPGYEGTGIGLALVRKTAERMGGRAGVESETGVGSRFWLEFKKAARPAPAPDLR